jgi:hypothetical protein
MLDIVDAAQVDEQHTDIGIGVHELQGGNHSRGIEVKRSTQSTDRIECRIFRLRPVFFRKKSTQLR